MNENIKIPSTPVFENFLFEQNQKSLECHKATEFELLELKDRITSDKVSSRVLELKDLGLNLESKTAKEEIKEKRNLLLNFIRFLDSPNKETVEKEKTLKMIECLPEEEVDKLYELMLGRIGRKKQEKR